MFYKEHNEKKIEAFSNTVKKDLVGKKYEYFLDYMKVFLHCASRDTLEEYVLSDWVILTCLLWDEIQKRQDNEIKVNIIDGQALPHWKHDCSIISIVMDDMPFLVDSVQLCLRREDCFIYDFINSADQVVSRSKAGIFKGPQGSGALKKEAYIVFLVNHMNEKEAEKLKCSLMDVLHDVQCAVRDWRPMQDQMRHAIDELSALPSDVFDPDYMHEVQSFFTWLIDYFTFIGYREYDVVGSGKKKALEENLQSALGVLSTDRKKKASRKFYSDLPEKARAYMLAQDKVFTLGKTKMRATFHRPTNTDIICIKRFNHKNEVIGERRFIGLFTSDAYDSDPSRIPLLRKKVATVLQRSQLPPHGYTIKKLEHLLKTFPRDELFQLEIDEISRVMQALLDIHERPMVRLFLLPDQFCRFTTALIYLPNENNTLRFRNRVKQALLEALDGKAVVEEHHFASESVLVRLRFVVKLDPDHPIQITEQELEARVQGIAKIWVDDLLFALKERHGMEKGRRIFQAARWQFPASYQERYGVAEAVEDLDIIGAMSEHHPIQLRTRIIDQTASDGRLSLKFYEWMHRKIDLSVALSFLKYVGLTILSEHTYSLQNGGDQPVNMSEFICSKEEGVEFSEAVSILFNDLFFKVFYGVIEDDPLNQLVLKAELSWHDILILRAYAQYAKQLGFSLSQNYIYETFVEYSDITKLLIQYFKYRFELGITGRKRKMARCHKQILETLESIQTLDQDRIFSQMIGMMEATVRTNAYQQNLELEGILVLKIQSDKVPNMPLPAPKFEIFIYSNQFEGVHLRGDKVARGGIRWSDRRDDFRTEVLGLMKTQQIKNAIIVPHGAKGGFVVKNMPTDQHLQKQEGVRCYKLFIQSLLCITDNIVSGETIQPRQTVCHDKEPDAYIVAAADKGTATFSDYANEISEAHGFWLGDAFASGGAHGYDHKAMGITARGAWESVKAHAHALGMNLDQDPFTVIGIGGMEGDVFGNGMLLSRNIQLVAAFNHRYIFIDPNPDTKASYLERERLFHLGNITWLDYKPSLISKGGGVFSRTEKSITLTTEMKALLGVKDKSMTPNQMIRAILKAKADLLFNGGIGTYVKASTESDIDVGDPSNDALRVNAKQLRCRMIGEGGNLGFTQLGRIEFALMGGRVVSDFIDNSAGVDCSDYEVNIKILLNQLIKEKKLTAEERNRLMPKMADNVGALVLKHNMRQNMDINVMLAQLPEATHVTHRFIEGAQAMEVLDPELEYLPSRTETEVRLSSKGCSFVAPELAVLLSYAKIILQREILDNTDESLHEFDFMLPEYFPDLLVKKYEKDIALHPLRRAIIATQLSSQFISEVGFTFLENIRSVVKADLFSIIRAYLLVRKLFGLDELIAELEEKELGLPHDIAIRCHLEIRGLLRKGISWMLVNHPGEEVSKIEAIYHPLFTKLRSGQLSLGDKDLFLEKKSKKKREAEEPLVHRIHSLSSYYVGLMFAQIGSRHDFSFENTHRAAEYLFAKLNIAWLHTRLMRLCTESYWQSTSVFMVKHELEQIVQSLLVTVLKQHQASNDSVEASIDAWMKAREGLYQERRRQLMKLEKQKTLEFEAVFVLVKKLSSLL